MNDYKNILTIEPGKRSRQPCIRGIRITVYDVFEYLASGMTVEEILHDFPELTETDIRACFAYAADKEKSQVVVYTDEASETSLSKQRQFLTFRKKERHRILSEQAKEMADFYENDPEWREWEGGHHLSLLTYILAMIKVSKISNSGAGFPFLANNLLAIGIPIPKC